MKIKVTQTVDVDPELWAEAYGVEESKVREDVKAYFSNYCQEQVDYLNLHPRHDARALVSS